MKTIISILLVLFVEGGTAFSQKKTIPAPRTKREKIGYSLGVKIAQNMKKDGVDKVDTEFLIAGLRDVLNDRPPSLSEQTIDSLVGMVQNELEEELIARQKAEGEQNKKDGANFLAANKNKKDVRTTQSGLQYKILKAGNGPLPRLGQKVKCHYRGAFINGKEFQNSYKPNTPVTYTVGGQEIKGWNEALLMMPVGSKWQLYVPPNLAYGEKGAQPIVGSNVTIILDLELLSIESN